MIFLHKLQGRCVISAGPVMMACVVFIAAMAGGCTSGLWGSLDPDSGVTSMFRENSVPEDFKYYVCGRDTMPYAIAGIDPSYEFDSKLWYKAEPNGKKFSKQVAFIWDPQVPDSYDTAKGSWILDSKGNKIGVWYSRYPRASVKIDNENMQIVIYCPHRVSEDNY